MALSLDTVFFDLGGTLFSYRSVRRPLGRVIREAAQRLGSKLEAPDVGRAYSRASARAFADVGTQPFYLHRDLFLETYRQFARELQTPAPPEADFLEWLYEAQRNAMIDHLELREDCLSTLESLRKRGLQLVIVSNIDNDFLEPMVAQSGLSERVDAWLSSETAESCKPDARFFQMALEQAGRTPDRVLFVGDSPVHDIAGARALGMQTALIEEDGIAPPGQDGGEVAEPHFRIRALAELLPLVPEA